MTLLHPVNSSALLVIILKQGLSYLTWSLVSLGLLRLTHHCCTHLSLGPAVQTSTNQVSALSALAAASACSCDLPAQLYIFYQLHLSVCCAFQGLLMCGRAKCQPGARLLCTCKHAQGDRCQRPAHMSIDMLVYVIAMLMYTYCKDAFQMSLCISTITMGMTFRCA